VTTTTIAPEEWEAWRLGHLPHEPTAAGDSITLTVARQAPTYFIRSFGFIGISITSTVRTTVSSFTMVHSKPDIMP